MSKHEHDPFWSIIEDALQKRGKVEGDNEIDLVYRVPRYVVRLCERLLEVIKAEGNTRVEMQRMIVLEHTCTGADYQSKLALRCHELVQSSERQAFN